jgi:predicted MFS family arabinose efflux permease
MTQETPKNTHLMTFNQSRGGQEARDIPGPVTIWGFAFSMCLIGAFFLALSPILESMASELAAHQYSLGYPGGAYSLGLGITALVCSSFQDRIAKRWLMLMGISLHAAGALVISLSFTWAMVVLGYALCGIGVGLFQPAVYGYVVANAANDSRARLLGRVNMGWAGSTLLGVPFAAHLSESVGWRKLSLLVIVVWSIIALMVFKVFVRSGTPGRSRDVSHWSVSVIRELHRSRVSWLFLITILVFIGFYGVYSFLGLTLIEEQGYTAGATGVFVFWYGLGFLTGSLLTRAIDRIGDRTALVIAALGLGTVIMFMPVSLGSLPALSLLMLLWGYFQVSAFTAITSIAGSMCPEHRGRSLSLKSSSVMLGASLGTVTMGIVNARFGYETVTLVCGLITWLAALLTRLYLKEPVPS